MGMFDWFKSSYELPILTNELCQTKDLSNTMDFYWLDPHGYLYEVDYSETHEFVSLDEDDPDYDHKFLWTNHKFVPNGKRGKVRLYDITDYIEVYSCEWDGHYEDWPRLRLHFIKGRLVEPVDRISKK